MEETEKQQVEQAVHPETAPPQFIRVGDKDVPIRPLKRGWHKLFRAEALPIFGAETEAIENMQRILADTMALETIAGAIVQGDLKADEHLDRAAAVILASVFAAPGEDRLAAVEKYIKWAADSATTKELRALVEAQAERERLVQEVGESLPARFARLANLAGDSTITADSVKRHLTNFLQKSQEQAGSGN